MNINVKTIGEAWLKSCRLILEKGIDEKDGAKNLKEVMHLMITIKKPSQKDEIIEKYADKEMLEWMTSNFFEQKNIPELGNSKSYGFRLFNYDGKNQIQWVIDKLKSKPETKAATITTLTPNWNESYIPCVSLLDFKIRNEKLVLTAVCRAIDFGKKVYANILVLNKIQETVAKKLNISAGELVFDVISAHIYEEDFENINGVLIKNER